MAFIIQKYGGTSLADDESRDLLANKVIKAMNRGDRIVVVVSAMGRRGDPYATDTLLDLVKRYEGGSDGLIRDLAAACGELISCSVIAAMLNARGVRAEPLSAVSAGIHAEGPFEDAMPAMIDPARIRDVLAKGTVPVVAGFQAIDAQGHFHTLGRGGSDTTAVALAAALKADYVDIYKDVPGVAKADPRLIPRAPFMEFLDYESMFRLANHGARVLHDKSALLARQNSIRIRVRSTFDDGPGTLIAAPQEGYSVPHFIGLANSPGPGGSMKLTLVFAQGEGKDDIAKAREWARMSGYHFALNEIDDDDAVSFVCETASAKEFANALYERFA
ncbi:MAG: hypothetical protein N3A02_01335 [Rectinema sp.]|nr:hypothetical protein [Rectinema sp.]